MSLYSAGLSMDCLQEWGDFMRLGIPGMLMLGAEWWTYELGAFLAGKLYKDSVL